MNTCRARAAVLAILTVLAMPHAASAQTDSPEARALFAEGRRLMKEGQFDSACPKLEAARTIYPGSGVLLNLADCYEQAKRIASAWSMFAEAATVASHSNRPADEVEARRRQLALESRLAKMTITIRGSIAAIVVKRDGVPVEPGAFGVAIPLDPGKHVVSAQAPGYVAWDKTISIGDTKSLTEIEIPELLPSPEVQTPQEQPTVQRAPAVQTAETTKDESNPRRGTVGLIGWSFLGAGVLGIGIGAAFGATAHADFSQQQSECSATDCKSHAQAVVDHQNATSAATISTVGVIAGAALAAVGVVLLLTRPTSDRGRVGTLVKLAPLGAGGAVVLGFDL